MGIRESLQRYLDTNGDGTGTKNANVNGSVTPVVFKIQPSADQAMEIGEVIIHIEDVGGFDSGKYGNAIIMANGIEVGVYNTSNDALLRDMLDGIDVLTNHDWGRTAQDIQYLDFGTGNPGLFARWTFNGGEPIELTEDEYLGITINDDLTGLVEHFFFAHGSYKRGAPE